MTSIVVPGKDGRPFRWGVAAAVLVPIICLAPFVNKAVHVDDTVYFWVAERILENPFDFFGFEANWEAEYEPMYDINKNPPGVSYFIALVAAVAGWNEVVLHLAFLFPAVAASLGIFFLARRFTARPLLATMTAVLTPVFLVSGSNMMADTMMLAFYVWSVCLWIKGLDEGKNRPLVFAAVLIGMGLLVKYITITAIPLLLVYTVIRQRRFSATLGFFLVPIAILVAYDFGCFHLYGQSIIIEAAGFSAGYRAAAGWTHFFTNTLTNLSYMGGCYAAAFFFVPILWRWRVVGGLAGLVVVTAVFLLARGGLDARYLMYDEEGVRWGFLFQQALFIAAGIHLMLLAVFDVYERRDRYAVVLFLWVVGIFAFSGYLNWTINARALLPMAPAVGILVARRIDARDSRRRHGLWPLVPAACIALAVTFADYRFAETGRTAAREVQRLTADRPGAVWFQGHWGFQYYMEAAGALPMDLANLDGSGVFRPPSLQFDPRSIGFSAGDVMVVPAQHRVFEMPLRNAIEIHTLFLPTTPWLATMHKEAGAGFYTYSWGPLPFFFGPVSPEKYTLYEIVLFGDLSRGQP